MPIAFEKASFAQNLFDKKLILFFDLLYNSISSFARILLINL